MSNSLWEHSDAPVPKLSVDVILAGLSAAAKPSSDAALAFLVLRFTPARADAFFDRDVQLAELKALDVAASFRGTWADRFLAEVPFNVVDPSALQLLWPVLTDCVQLAALEAKLTLALEGDNALHALNALSLPRQVFGIVDGYSASAGTMRKLYGLAARWTTHAQPSVRREAEAFLRNKPPIDHAALVAEAYDQLGGGAREAASAPKVAGKKATTRSVAPLVSASAFATRMVSLGVAEEVTALLPRLAGLPAQMRVLTLEGLFAAQTQEEASFVIEQTQPLLR